MLSVLQKLDGMLASIQSEIVDVDEEIPEIKIRSREHRSQEIGNALQKVMDIDAGKIHLCLIEQTKRLHAVEENYTLHLS